LVQDASKKSPILNPDPESPFVVETTESATAERQSSRWDIRNARRNYVSLFVFQIGSALFSFASIWVITRYLGSAVYGGIVAVIAASQVAQVFVNWTGATVVRFGVDEFVESATIARTFWVRLFVLTVNLVFVVALSPFWFTPLAGWLKLTAGSFWLVVAHFIVSAFWIHIQMSLQGAKILRVQGLLQVLERALILSGIFLLLILHRLELTGIVLCYIAGPALMTLIGFIKIRNLVFSRFGVDRDFFKRMLVYSLPLLPLSVVGYFAGNYVDAIFITSFLSTRDLGVYSVATQINGILIQFPTLVNLLLIPFFVTLDKEAANEKLKSYFVSALPNIVLVWGLLCTMAGLVCWFLIPMIFGSDFSDASVPFWILSTSSVMAVPVLCGYAALTHARSKTYIAAVTSLLSAVVNIGLNLMLIPRFGMAGCAWGTVVAYLVSATAFAVLLRIKAEMPISWVFLALMPNLCGSLAFSMTGNIWFGAAIGSGLFVFVLGLKRRSVSDGIFIARRILRT
jgi:O-antigen/teichoic acid export membrane protein